MAKNTKNVSQDELDEYIHVTRSGVYIVILALALILVAAIIWAVFGRIPITIKTRGFVTLKAEWAEEVEKELEKDVVFDFKDDDVIFVCCLDATTISDDELQKMDSHATLIMPDGVELKATVEGRRSLPVGKAFLAEEYFYSNEWLVNDCVPSAYNWAVEIRAEGLSGYLFNMGDITLTLGEESPISFFVKEEN